MGIKRRIFYSFDYDNDVCRVQQLRNIGAFEEDKPVTPNKWEEVKGEGDKAIKDWIDDNIRGKTCIVVLIGSETSKSKWVEYEIKRGWEEGKAIVGIYIHNLKDPNYGKSSIGLNPFDKFNLNNTKLSSIVKCYNPSPEDAYNEIADNLSDWVEEAIQIRNKY